MHVISLLRRLEQFSERSSWWRYLATLGGVTVVSLGMPYVPVTGSVRAMAVIISVLAGAWIGGLGPSLLLGPLIFVIGRLANERPPNTPLFSFPDIFGVLILTVIIGAVGLGGTYRRRIRAITESHGRKLRDQARAISLAHIIFRDVDGRVTEWNEGAEQMFGWEPSAAIGQNLHELLQTQFPAPLAEIQEELLRTGQWEGEVSLRREDGVKLIAATHWILYRDAGGNPVGVAEVYNDVSELRRAEEAVRQADRRKDEFLALLAHELRNPLAPIRTGLELMKISLDDPETLEETRRIMERQTQQLVTLVDDLLDVSRITRGKLELRKKRVNLLDVMRNAVEASQPFIQEGGHQFSLDLPELPIQLEADPHRLAQVLSNLLNNAAKFTPAGGSIRMRAEPAGERVIVSIQDSGVGIPAELQSRIFELFEQIDRPQARGYAGLGIGLTLVKSLIDMHGGRVEVESTGQNAGSTFRVILPILQPTPLTEDSPAESSSDEPPLTQRRVLVVDDNLAAAELLSRVVESQGHEVRTAHDGEQALEVAADFLPELILMDLGMPRMDGFEAAGRIRQQPWGRDLMLVALTGWGQDDDRRRTREAGFDRHLVKPAEPAELQRLFREIEERIRVEIPAE